MEDDTFVVINGKIITEINLEAAFSTHRQRQALATLILRRNREWDRFSIVEADGDGRIRRFGGFPTPLTREGNPSTQHGGLVDDSAPLMFTGIQILEPEIFEFIPRGRFSHTTLEAYPRAIEAGRLIAAHVAEERWYDLSTLDRYLRASLELLQQQGTSILLGWGSNVENGADVTGSILWERVFVNRSAKLHHCIVGDDVVIPPDSRFERVAIVRAALCSGPPERGSIIGDNLVVPF